MKRLLLFLALLGTGLSGAAGAATGAAPQSAELTQNPAELVQWEGKGTPFLDYRLVRVMRAYRDSGQQAAEALIREQRLPVAADGALQLMVHAGASQGLDPWTRPASQQEEAEAAILEVAGQAIEARLRLLGGRVRGRAAGLIEVEVPIAALDALADPNGSYGWVQPSPQAVPMVVGQGVQVVGADQLQESAVSYGPPASPVRIGILDTGFLGYDLLLGTELPSSVTVESFHPGGITAEGTSLDNRLHGTAVAEIVYDMAPEAQLFLVNAGSAIDHANAVSWLIDRDVDVISNSVAWFNAGPGDGRGPINDDVRRAMASGSEWVVAAGNHAQRHWEGPFNDPDGDGLHNFAPGDESNAMFLQAGQSITALLNWNDWFLSDQDYDFAVVAPNGAALTSEGAQTGFQQPTEALSFTAPVTGFYHFLIFRFSATGSETLEIFLISGSGLQYQVPSGSITIPADTDGAIAVGATHWADDVLEPFSSHGPTADGRSKPDISAPDNVDSVVFGGPFSGTSAAAPHVAGAIALMKSRFGVFSFDQIVEILLARADPKGDPNQYGAGRLDVVGR